jgi:murein endopeptidase
MRALVGLVVAMGLFASTADADTRSRHRPTKHDDAKSKKRAARLRAVREREHIEPRLIAHGQSVGAPWAGHLQHATPLPPGDGYFLRRPERAFGTETTIDLTLRAIGETLDAFPDEHILAIGDISARSGGFITQHHSHQSGRDIDVGLFYLDKPDDYPANFVHADEDNLDCAATFKLLESFLATTDDDGGVQMVFLDFDVQGILYHWALDSGVSERRLDRIFQYPHGRGSPEGIVRHEPNHDNHMHVRFRCPSEDTGCH